jgi:hypothetical protein
MTVSASIRADRVVEDKIIVEIKSVELIAQPKRSSF